MPCGARASHETVARAMKVLRLTRWFSLVRRHCRDRRTGRILGNLYVLHDEPLTPYEAIELDPDYLALVSRALAHPTLSVRRVGIQVLKEMSEDPHLAGRELPSRLHLLMQRLRAREAGAEDAGAAATYPQDEGRRESEEGLSDSEESPHDAEESGKTSESDGKTLLRNRKTPASESESLSSESEAGEKPAPDDRLRNPKRDSTVRTVQNNDLKVRTVPRAREPALEWPEAFRELKREQQAGALLALEQVDGGQRQAVLDEWAARCRDSAIRNPAGYLYGIIQKALRGEFKAWAGPQGERGQPPPLAPDAGRQAAKERPAKAEDKPAGPEAVQKYLAQLRSILKF